MNVCTTQEATKRRNGGNVEDFVDDGESPDSSQSSNESDLSFRKHSFTSLLCLFLIYLSFKFGSFCSFHCFVPLLLSSLSYFFIFSFFVIPSCLYLFLSLLCSLYHFFVKINQQTWTGTTGSNNLIKQIYGRSHLGTRFKLSQTKHSFNGYNWN